MGIAGAVGGLINALLTDNRSPLPQKEPDGARGVSQPGLLVNILLGALAGILSAMLYGQYSQLPITGIVTGELIPKLVSVGSAVIIGMGGARWLTAEADKRFLKAAAVQAAGTDASQSRANDIANAGSPREALRAAMAPRQDIR